MKNHPPISRLLCLAPLAMLATVLRAFAVGPIARVESLVLSDIPAAPANEAASAAVFKITLR